MINYKQFEQIKDLQILGVEKKEISRRTRIGRRDIDKWWEKSEEEFFSIEKQSIHELENYREYILDQLRLTPQLRCMNMLYKLKENFPDFAASTSTFYRYMRRLREEAGLVPLSKRVMSTRVREIAGEEAQVDFGQFKMKTAYGTNVKVYLFCMVLSHSSMRFIHFEPNPFTTATAIKAHEYAFQFFGGITRSIMYDNDRVFVQAYNYGNIIFVKAF
ncbi:MAG: DDE-type integrase/transposase/recombinase [Firmicutes bacterium]|nr:DDE-type integrase/transposase/recombinase [Bacillota bacterium]